jgi:hypothetical protein
MTKYREVLSLSPTDAAYIAGLVDGEGTITLSRKHSGEQRQLVVSISNTERPLLDFVLRRVGAGKVTSKRMSKPHHALGLTYTLCNRQALTFLEQIAPFLQSYKRKRARLVLDNYIRLTPRNGKYTSTIRAQRSLFEAEVLSLRANP